ncbi:MAG: non-homologous end-joining DNA ligase [Polyangiaceae bacterium]
MRGYRLCDILPGSADEADLGASPSFDLAWDGHRVLATVEASRVRIASADGQPWQALFPALEVALRRLPVRRVALEGHLVALDAAGRPSFDELSRMVEARDTKEALLVVWDLLHLDGEDMRDKPLVERRSRLAQLLKESRHQLVLSEPLSGDLDQVLASVRALGMRGIVARPKAAPYPTTDAWRSLACGAQAIAWARSLSPPPVVTNADKVLFPRDGYRKRDIVAYYRDVAPLLLPHMAGRPIVAQRWPDGIDDFTWYQHRVPPRRHAPDYLESIPIDGDRRLAVRDERSLLWLVNQAALTFHGWASRAEHLDEPDWAVIDLDPGEATSWETTIEIALAIRKLLELLELESVVKTSGQSGLHVLVPMAPGQTPQDAHDLARGVSIMIARLKPEAVALDAQTERRGRLFLDHMQHYVGKMLVLPYSLRAADGAPVSTPIAWEEVTPALRPGELTLASLRNRLDRVGDLAAPLLEGGVHLRGALARLRQSGALADA